MVGARTGHWTGVLLRNNVIEWFDPYGLSWDKERGWLSNRDLVSLHESQPLLARLFDRSSFQAVYSPFRFQVMSDSISTCGRHTCTRLQHPEIDTDGYAEWMVGQCKEVGEPPDVVVTIRTLKVLGH